MNRIPEISEKRLEEMFKDIKPVVRKGNDLYYIKPCHLREMAFTWDPRRTEKVTKFKEIARIKTYHEYGHPSLFKPSIAEVLAQIPKKLIKGTMAFETISPGDVNEHLKELNEGYHVAETILYSVG